MLCLFHSSIRVLRRFLQFAVLSATNAAVLQLVSSFQPKSLLLQFARFFFFFFPAKKRCCCCKFARFFQPKRCLQVCSVQPNAVFLCFFSVFASLWGVRGRIAAVLSQEGHASSSRPACPLLVSPLSDCGGCFLCFALYLPGLFRFSLVFCWCLRHGDRVTLVNTLCTCTGNTR